MSHETELKQLIELQAILIHAIAMSANKQLVKYIFIFYNFLICYIVFLVYVKSHLM